MRCCVACWPTGSAVVLLRQLSFIVSWISSLSPDNSGPVQHTSWRLIVFVLFWTVLTSRQSLWTTATDIYGRLPALRAVPDIRCLVELLCFYQCRNPAGINRKCLVKLSWFSTLCEMLRVRAHVAQCLHFKFNIYSVLDDVRMEIVILWRTFYFQKRNWPMRGTFIHLFISCHSCQFPAEQKLNLIDKLCYKKLFI